MTKYEKLVQIAEQAQRIGSLRRQLQAEGNAVKIEIPTKDCPSCNGTGYERQPPNTYGLSTCTTCYGSRRVLC